MDQNEDFYVRYYVGHKGQYGHEFLEFEFRKDGRLRYANNSNYKSDKLIRKEVFVNDIVLSVLKRIIDDSEILKEDDSNWPRSDKNGRQELEIKLGKTHISFSTSKIGSLSDIKGSKDADGLAIFFYLIQFFNCKLSRQSTAEIDLQLFQIDQMQFQTSLTRPLIEAAGTDITYWFDPKTKEPRKMIDVNTGLEKFYCPKGEYLHIPPLGPETNFDLQEVQTPWWRNSLYFIGRLTVKSVKIKIINMLTEHSDIIEVPCEETINEILERYKEINKHAGSYTWKRLGRPLDMELNLEENNIIDQTDEFERLGVPEKDWYWPVIHLYFDDDLTVA